jgi:hypothetical protein
MKSAEEKKSRLGVKGREAFALSIFEETSFSKKYASVKKVKRPPQDSRSPLFSKNIFLFIDNAAPFCYTQFV